MWHSHKTAVLNTYWTNCYHRFFFMTFRTKMIHRVFPAYFSVKIGGTGQPLNYSWLCCTCSPHPIISAVSLDPEILVSYGRWVSAGWESSLPLLWGILGKGAKLGEMWWEWKCAARCEKCKRLCFLDPLASAYLAERTLAATDVGTARYKAGSSSDFN